jgi:hypothetical protein
MFGAAVDNIHTWTRRMGAVADRGMTMYEIKSTGQRFNSFLMAIEVAHSAGSEVIEVETGISRWQPAPKVSEKRMRKYHEQKAAFAAQESLK